MKPHIRRRLGWYPYYKVSIWNTNLLCWQELQRTFNTIDAAQQFAITFDKYSIIEVTEDGKHRALVISDQVVAAK